MRHVLLSLVLLGAAGCAKHGVDAVKEMRALACAGDAVGFLDRVDRNEMIRTARPDWEKKAEASYVGVAPADLEAARENFRKHVDSAISTSIDDTFTEWRSDISRGSASDLCHMSVMDSSEHDDTADVHISTPGAGDYHWRMARNGGRWKLVHSY